MNQPDPQDTHENYLNFFPYQNPPVRTSFLTNRLEHAKYVLSSNLHPFDRPPKQMNLLPVVLLPPLPETDVARTVREVKEIKAHMYNLYTASYWRRALLKLRVERGYDGPGMEDIDDDHQKAPPITRYIRGYVSKGVYRQYNHDDVSYEPPVSIEAMETIVDLIPLDVLAFHPQKKYLATMELSSRGLGRAIFMARENATFFEHFLHEMILCHTGNPSTNLLWESSKVVNSFLNIELPRVSQLFTYTLGFLEARGEDPHTLKVLLLYRNGFETFIQRLQYVSLVLKLHAEFNTSVSEIVSEINVFQKALLSIEDWK